MLRPASAAHGTPVCATAADGPAMATITVMTAEVLRERRCDGLSPRWDSIGVLLEFAPLVGKLQLITVDPDRLFILTASRGRLALSSNLRIVRGRRAAPWETVVRAVGNSLRRACVWPVRRACSRPAWRPA